MNKLRRTDWRDDGVFGEFTFEGDEAPCMVTLEHAYEKEAKVSPGVYTCRRGMHQLGAGFPFETFEILGVKGHSGILFHAGNYNKDSHGCVLCGQAIHVQPNGEWMITASRATFEKWREKLAGVDEFQLEVL